MERRFLKINKNGETLTITKSAAETNGQLTEFEGTDEPNIGPPMHVHFKQEERIKVEQGKMRVKTLTKDFLNRRSGIYFSTWRSSSVLERR